MPTNIVIAIDDSSNIDGWGLRPIGGAGNAWSAGTYPKGTVVTYSGSLYYATQNTSQTPGIGSDWIVLIPSIIGATGAVFPQGGWNATTNVPALASGVGTEGYLYRVSTAGTTTLNGVSSWNVDDLLLFTGGAWRKVRGQIVNSSDIADATAAGRTILTSADAAAQRTALGLGTAAVKNTGTTADTIPLLDADGRLFNQRVAASAGWGVVTKSVGVQNESGIYFDSSNNSWLDTRDAAGVLRTRWSSISPNGHLLDGLPAYVCRAWVNFNGTGTVAIRASGNVSSITDNGVGDYTVNFTTAMPDANYCAALSCRRSSASDGNLTILLDRTNNPTTTAFRLRVSNASAGGVEDTDTVFASFFR